MTRSGLASILDDISNFLKVDVDVSQDEAPDAKYPAIVSFVVTNTSQPQEFQTDIVFEEVQLKVGVPTDWHTEKAQNLSSGQSFHYEHRCKYDEIMKVQWALEGRISPAVLLTFHRRPSSINRNKQLPVKAYFDFLEQMNIHRWLGQIQSCPVPSPDTTLAEMKSKEDTLSTIATELVNSGQQLQEFLGFVNFDRSRDDILQHRNTIVEYLNRTQREIGDLIQRLRSRDIEGFSRARDATVKKLTDRASDLDKATETLGHKLGILAKTINGDSTDTESSKAQPPPSIPLREIDLHSNHNIEEAIPMLEKFIRESYRDNVGSIRIVHGKGIGVLRNAVRLHLESHKLIKSFGPADKDHGGEGATEAKMVDLSADLL